jgi:multidrug efflux pump subunit AcrA (membrane-fusion protein)
VEDSLWEEKEDNMGIILNLIERTRTLEEAAEATLDRVRRLEGERALRKAYAEDRLARLEGAIRALARRVRALEAALHAHAQAQAEARAQERTRRLEMAKVELEDLAPRVFAKRGGDVDVLVAADHLRELLAQGRLEDVEPVLARWRAELQG